MTEEKALKQMQQGSQEALCLLIERYTPYVSTVIHNIIGSSMAQADIEETTADVFFTLWQNAKKVRVQSLKSYLAAVARNLALKKLRETGKTLSLEDDRLVLETEAPENEMEKKELGLAVRRAVLDMGEPDREIFLRHYFFFQPLSQISQEMGIGLSALKSRLYRGREKLKAELMKLF